MPREILTPDAKHHGDEYPPSRPSVMMFLIAAVVIAAVMAIMNWQVVSTAIYLPQIKSGLGL